MPRTIKQPRKPVVKKLIPEMLPKIEWLEESLVPSYLNINPDHFRKTKDTVGLKISSMFGKRYYSVKQINELIEDSIIYNPPI